MASLIVGWLDLFSKEVLFFSFKSFMVLPGCVMFTEKTCFLQQHMKVLDVLKDCGVAPNQ